MGLAIQLWQYVLCATGNAVSCHNRVWWWYGTKPSWTKHWNMRAGDTFTVELPRLLLLIVADWHNGRMEKLELTLPRTAQQQYDVTQHIPLSEAQAGDLVFFHSTHNAGSYITHVGIYLGNNRMFHAGDPIGYADLTSPYWQQHLVGSRTNQTMRKEDLMMKFRKIRIKKNRYQRKRNLVSTIRSILIKGCDCLVGTF